VDTRNCSKYYLRKRRAERRCCLNSWKADLSDAIAVRESKDASRLAERNTLLDATDCPIKLGRVADVVRVGEDERLVDIEADCEDVLRVGNCETVYFVDGEVFPEKLFIVCELNDQRNVKRLLQRRHRRFWHRWS